MSATSIQNAGTATTRSAKPKPIGASSASRSAQRGISSRTRSCPVTPRCSRPAASSRGISAADSSTSSTPSTPRTLPRYSRPAAAARQRDAARGEPGDRLLLQPPLRRHPELQPHQRHQRLGPDDAADRRDAAPCPEHPGQRVVAPAAGDRRQVGAAARQRAEDEAVVVLERGAPEARLEAQRRRARCRAPPARRAAPAKRSTAAPSPGEAARQHAAARASAASARCPRPPAPPRSARPRRAASGGVAASSASRATRAATSSASRSPTARAGARRPARPSPRPPRPRAGPPARARDRGVAVAEAMRAARGSGAGRQTWRRSAALRAALVSSASIAASTSPRSPVTSSTGASPSASTISPSTSASWRRRIAGLEDLEARPAGTRAAGPSPNVLPPPDRPAVDVARRLRAGVHVQPHDRHGEVGAQHHLRALVAGDEGARADVLAVEVEQHVGRLQRRRLDPHRAGRAEHAEDARDLGVEPRQRRAHARALQVGPVGDHQAPRASIARTAATSSRARHLDLRRLGAPVLVRRRSPPRAGRRAPGP